VALVLGGGMVTLLRDHVAVTGQAPFEHMVTQQRDHATLASDAVQDFASRQPASCSPRGKRLSWRP